MKGGCFPIVRTSASTIGGCFMKKVLSVFALSTVLLLLLASAAFAQNYMKGAAASASPTATARLSYGIRVKSSSGIMPSGATSGRWSGP